MILQNEKINAYSHGVIIPVMIAVTVYFAVIARGDIKLELFLFIYGVSAVILFSASFLYHVKKKFQNDRSVWRKLDRSAIFILIAGTATPLYFFYLDGTGMWLVLAALWLAVSLAIALIFSVSVPRKISTLLYISIGVLCIIPVIKSINKIPLSIFILFIAGDISYLAGAVIYAVKKPNLHIDFHEIFHMFVIAGAIFHMFMILDGVTIYLQ